MKNTTEKTTRVTKPLLNPPYKADRGALLMSGSCQPGRCECEHAEHFGGSPILNTAHPECHEYGAAHVPRPTQTGEGVYHLCASCIEIHHKSRSC